MHVSKCVEPRAAGTRWALDVGASLTGVGWAASDAVQALGRLAPLTCLQLVCVNRGHPVATADRFLRDGLRRISPCTSRRAMAVATGD